MPVTLNASTASGLIATSDTSGTIQLQSNGTTKATISSSGFSYPGGVLQVVSTTKTDTFSMTGQTWTDITGFSVSITPTSASSKILILFNTSISVNTGGYSGGVRLLRGSTAICLGDAAGSRIQSSNWQFANYAPSNFNLSNSFLDSPATTSATTYKMQLISGYAGQTVYINRNYSDTDDAGVGRYPSTITVMEIAV
jgi:hypothetical protein